MAPFILRSEIPVANALNPIVNFGILLVADVTVFLPSCATEFARFAIPCESNEILPISLILAVNVLIALDALLTP